MIVLKLGLPCKPWPLLCLLESHPAYASHLVARGVGLAEELACRLNKECTCDAPLQWVCRLG